MRNKILKLSVLLMMALLLIAADTPSPAGLLVQSFDVSAYPTIQVRVSAWDSNGMPADALSSEHFVLRTKDGTELKPTKFEFQPDAQVKVALAMDISASMRGMPILDAKSASYRFLDRMTKGDQIALIAFSDKVSLYRDQFNPERELPFSEDFVPVYDTIEALEAFGGTELYNAVYKAVELTSQLQKGHRAVLLFSDGRNESSVADDPEAAIKLAKEEGIPIFIIGLGSAIDRDYLERLSSETGGVARFTPKSSELAQAFDDMARLLKGQYVLTFELPEPSGEAEQTVEINVDVKGENVEQPLLLENLPEPVAEAIEEPAEEPTEVDSPEETYPITEEAATDAEETMPDPTEDITQTDTTEIAPPEAEKSTPDEGPHQDKTLELIKKPISWYWFAGGGVLLALLASIIICARRKAQKPKLYKCGRCGFALAEGETACKQCGETRKIER